MRAYCPFLAAILVLCACLIPVQAEEIKNGDGTFSSTQTIEDINKEHAKPYDPLNRGVDMSLSKTKMTQEEKEKMFPGTEAKRIRKEIARENMTQEERDQEKKMLDRTPDVAKPQTKNKNLKELNSIPVR